ncbi:DUF4391 domain-containing protein [Vibrio gallicus]|uniref:DUF4391 domain-containing protein n=1 Tax=Vibrio gallicus TaxID=190897 RepID=UPI0021C359DA|nr:DUF4391 domain-containing protein [Vibrio gallicus]
MQIESTKAEQVFSHFAFPKSTELGVKVPKKTIADNASLSSGDKPLIKEVLKSLVWRYTMKPETVNIPVFEDGLHEYKEIAILHVIVKSTNKTKQLCKLLHHQIPYPTMLVVEYEDSVALSLADKRINQVDHSKLTIEHQYDTGWIGSEVTDTFVLDFFSDFRFDHCSTLSLYDFYSGLIQKLNFLEAAKTTGKYGNSNEKDLTPLITELAMLEGQLQTIRNKIIKETQMNTKMRLNVEARKVKQAISAITSQLT